MQSFLFTQAPLLFTAEFFSFLEKYLLAYFHMFLIRNGIETSAAYLASFEPLSLIVILIPLLLSLCPVLIFIKRLLIDLFDWIFILIYRFCLWLLGFRNILPYVWFFNYFLKCLRLIWILFSAFILIYIHEIRFTSWLSLNFHRVISIRLIIQWDFWVMKILPYWYCLMLGLARLFAQKVFNLLGKILQRIVLRFWISMMQLFSNLKISLICLFLSCFKRKF